MKYDVVIVLKLRHLHIVRLAVEYLNQFANVRNIFMITANQNFKYLKKLAANIVLIDEDKLIPTMALVSLQRLPIKGFPKMAGWYYQQLLKLGASCIEQISKYYLIWDADTVLLKTLDFFDQNGKVLYTKAAEYHQPYFNLYKKIFNTEPNREFSFISQHMMVDKQIVQEIFQNIETRIEGQENWAWKLMKYVDNDNYRLSEYELYGHYVKKNYSDSVAYRDLPWLRDGTAVVSFFPQKENLHQLRERYYFVSFEYRPRNIFEKVSTRLRQFLTTV